MKKLIAKIRAILRNRRVRKIWTRTISSIACLVVFITTYALVLPAITMESEAACGIEAHQHDDSCYEERLICNLPESDGHIHTEDCYSTIQKLVCERSEHLHNSDCYDEDGNLTCSLEEHQHGEDCYEEIRELICGLEESKGHHHDSSCYEKVLTCKKEVHTHSPACYREDAASVAATEHAAVAATTTISADDAAIDENANASGTFDPAETAAEGYVPTLDELDFRQLLNDYTTIYYHRPEGSTEDSGQITDWQKVDEDTMLGETDILRVYLAYTIPAGSLNETNATARYRLPGNLHLTDEQMEAINQTENGLSGLYVDYDTLQITDTEKHSAYLGAEAVDGLRTPDQTIEDYLSDNNDTGDGEQTAQEIISAVVKANQVYDEDGVYGKKGAYLGTDLVFTFSPYTILKNRNEYDSEGTPVKAGESVSGWFTLDFNMDQIDWGDNAAEITFVSDDNDLDTGLVSVTLKKADPISEETPQETDPSSEESADSSNSDDEKTFIENSSTEENKAEAVEETHPAVSFEDSLTVHTGNLSSDTDAGNLPNSSKMTVSVSAEAGTFPVGTTMVLSAVTDMDAVAEAVEGTVDSKTCGFQAVDISFQDKDGNEIEPLKPISVTMRSDSIKAATEDSSMAPVVVHVEDQSKKTNDAASDLVTTVMETIPSSVDTNDDSESHGITDPSESISFKADSFSIYAIVYTVDFHYEVDGKEYSYSIPGGGFVSFEHLVEILGIGASDTKADNEAEDALIADEVTVENVQAAEDEQTQEESTVAYDETIKLNELEISEATKKFVADVENIAFSSPELVWVGKVESDAKVGVIKESQGLDIQYSVELTEEQIQEINNSVINGGDWILISLQPFMSEETLTVTMKNGDQFIVKVTDYQISTNVLTADGKNYKITVTYYDDAEIPAGTKLIASEIAPDTDEYLCHVGQTWAEVNKEYIEKEEPLKNNTGGLDDYSEEENIHPVNLDNARFFDITLINNGKKIDPKAPVQVDVQYIEGLKTEESTDPVIGVAHFVDEKVELIEDVKTTDNSDGEVVRFTYMQDSFSDIGTFVGQETTDNSPTSILDRISYPKLSAMRRATKGPLKEELGEPTATKELDDNEDGTYTLSLNVTGASKKKDEQPKANILFVMDRSSSMSKSSNDFYVEYTGDYQSGTTYYGSLDGTNYFTLNYSNGNYTYTTGYGRWTETHTYNGTVYTKTSRLKAEQEAMSLLFGELLENNKDTNGNYTKDNVEISVISFADDRGKMSEGTEYPKGGSTNGWTYSDYNGLMEVVNNENTPSGTNWEDALMYAKEVADAKKTAQPDEPVFVIFLTDGEPTAVYNEHGGAHHYIGDYGNVEGGGFIEAYKPSRDDAKAIVDANYEFYGIFTFNPGEEQTRYLKRLVHYAYTGYDVSDTTTGDFSYLDSSEYVNNRFYNANNPENLARAFDDILSAITTMIAHGNISIVDGLTTDAMTSTLVSGKADGFTYSVSDENGDTLYTVKATGNTSNPVVSFEINGTPYSGSQVEEKTGNNGKKYYSVTVAGKEYKMALADFVNTGEGDEEIKELTWDLSALGALENQYTYSLETVVWPNQEAYDYVAALNNGLMTWNTATQIPVYDPKDETKLKYYKNGVKDYPSIVLDPDTGIYSVLTNTKQELEYSIISTTNGVPTVEGPYTMPLDTPDPMDLKATASALEKVWNINRDPSILYKYLYESRDDQGNPVAFDIGFEIKRDDELYRTVNLPGKATVTAEGVTYDWSAYKTEDLVEYNGKTFSKRWSQDFSIATGLMLSDAQMDARNLDKNSYADKKFFFGNTWYYVLESGHDFKISEPAVGYEFDFEEPTYHPMLVDGVLMDVKFTTENGIKRISGMTALEIDTPTGKSALTVLNTLRGYINVKKKVVDFDGTTELTEDNTEFTFEVELTNAMPVFEGDHIPWYGINGLYYHDVDADDDYYQAEYINGKLQVTTEEGGPYEGVGTTFNPDYAGEQTITYIVDNQEVSVTICGNQMIPVNGSEEGGYKKVTATPKITRSETLYIANVPVNTHYSIRETGLAAQGYELIDIERQIGTGSPAAGAGNIEHGIEGEIVQNTETLITYTNRCLVTDITIKKTDTDGKGLEGAVFQLKKQGSDGYSESDASLIESVSGLAEITKKVNGETKTYTSAIESNGGAQTIKGLPDGTYRLYEVVVPPGYINTYRYIQFVIENRIIKKITTDTGDTSKLDTTANNIDLKIANEPGVALPHTGGPGTRLFTILGSILILGAGALLWRKRRFI